MIMRHRKLTVVWGISVLLMGAILATAQSSAPAKPPAQGSAIPPSPGSDGLGFTDTPMLPGLPYHVHDPARPHPPVVTPGAQPGAAPADAILLFDGKDLSQWTYARRPAGGGAGRTTSCAGGGATGAGGGAGLLLQAVTATQVIASATKERREANMDNLRGVGGREGVCRYFAASK